MRTNLKFLLLVLMIVLGQVASGQGIEKIAKKYLSKLSADKIYSLIGERNFSEMLKKPTSFDELTDKKSLNEFILTANMPKDKFLKQIATTASPNLKTQILHDLSLLKTDSKVNRANVLKELIALIIYIHRPVNIGSNKQITSVIFNGKPIRFSVLLDSCLFKMQESPSIKGMKTFIDAGEMTTFKSKDVDNWIYDSFQVHNSMLELAAQHPHDDIMTNSMFELLNKSLQSNAGIHLAMVLNYVFNPQLQSSNPGISHVRPDTGNLAHRSNLLKSIGHSVYYGSKVFQIRTDSLKHITYLYLGEAYPNQELIVKISSKVMQSFHSSPEMLFQNKFVYVKGTLISLEGKPEIIINDPRSISINN
ncbi:hypothetical protein [Mucilaginibacter polytrichastri]|uniref:Uncharacterized protein n=1 Tax=Mucilaginibacter polytrichastri TaxID=1302689 RepID=A0A1Q5ZWC3_9SPHI|nr:hypothetical protein [Mucilaginibacter polytrichastri]OKS86046.1 hypothetical protein RG47T_1493 [Mucilaginibacter polytrichastri]SFS59378.1 hypothetical protein SAMN04487890_10293 [Mucilaginibacter polytrichastri]